MGEEQGRQSSLAIVIRFGLGKPILNIVLSVQRIDIQIELSKLKAITLERCDERHPTEFSLFLFPPRRQSDCIRQTICMGGGGGGCMTFSHIRLPVDMNGPGVRLPLMICIGRVLLKIWHDLITRNCQLDHKTKIITRTWSISTLNCFIWKRANGGLERID